MNRPLFFIMKLRIEYISIDELREYVGNAKKHPEKQIKQIARSIEEFGFNDPIGIRGNTIVEGHGRYLALKYLGYKEKVPVIRLDHLTEDQMKAYVHIHNKLTMNSGFDMKILEDELFSIQGIDMEQYGFDLEGLNYEERHEENKEKYVYQTSNIQNLEKAQFSGAGMYDIPEILPVHEVPKVKQWIGFNYVLTDESPEEKGVHFFIDDYQFERIWNNIDKYVDKLKRYACVASPDFSPYTDMPFALQLYNHYRKHWVGRYLQENGVNVIPTVRRASDEKVKDWWLEGEPKNSVIITSSMWAFRDSLEENQSDYDSLLEKLNPKHVFLYGQEVEGLDLHGIATLVKPFSEQRWGR